MENEFIFLKKTSGLVKAAKASDVLIYNLGLISVGIAVTLCHFFVPANYPGANLVWSEIISGIFMLVIALTFWFWSIAIPRTGGIYAYVSRAIHPVVGFAVSFIDSMVWLFYNAFAATYLVYIGLSPVLYSLGIRLEDENLKELALLIQKPFILLAISSTAVIFSGFILTRGLKTFFAFQKILFLFAIIGTIATIYVLSKSSNNDFTEAFGKAFGVYPSMLPTTSDGIKFSLKMTVLASVWPLLSFVGSIFSVNMASEIQDVKRSQLLGIFGSIILSCIIMVALTISIDKVVPNNVQAAIVQYYNSPAHQPLSLTPYYAVLVSILAKSPLLIILICLGFFSWAFLWLPATINYSSKALLAWSFDRLTPAFVGYVSPKTFTPVNAISIIVVINILFLALYIFIPFFNSLILALAAMIAWIPVMISAIIFPYRKKSIYLQTPIAKMNILGLPAISVVGVMGLIAVTVLVAFLFSDPVAAGPNINTFGTIAILFSTVAIWYFIIKRKRAKENIDITKAFDEIPID